MLGAIIGDMAGSIYEFDPIKSKNFEIFNPEMRMTDDSLLTLAVAKVLMKHYPIDYSESGLGTVKKDLVKEFINVVKKYPYVGFGTSFYDWAKMGIRGEEAKPYNSYGNGSAMRISPVGWIANSEEEVKKLSKAVSEITHNHPEGIKGAEAVAMAIYLARNNKSKEEIKNYIATNYYPEITTFDYNDLVNNYYFSDICQKSVPQAIFAFLESKDLEDTIRSAIEIGGDCDTTGCIAGSIAEAYYQKDSLSEFETKYLNTMIKPDVKVLIKNFFEIINNKKYL